MTLKPIQVIAKMMKLKSTLAQVAQHLQSTPSSFYANAWKKNSKHGNPLKDSEMKYLGSSTIWKISKMHWTTWKTQITQTVACAKVFLENKEKMWNFMKFSLNWPFLPSFISQDRLFNIFIICQLFAILSFNISKFSIWHFSFQILFFNFFR